MIDLEQVRDQLAEIVAPPPTDPNETIPWFVYPRGFDNLAGWPMVAIGQPTWRPGPNWCISAYEWPVAVVVERPGAAVSFENGIRALDQLWPVIMERFRQTRVIEGTAAFHIVRSEFGLFRVQGPDGHPAQTIILSIEG